jgi:hypothetical protein
MSVLERLSEATKVKLEQVVELRRKAGASDGQRDAIISQIIALGQQLAELPQTSAEAEAAARAAENELIDLIRADVIAIATSPE